MMSRGLVFCIVLALLLTIIGSVPAFAQGPSLADIESEIDAVQWGVIYHQKDGCSERIEAMKLLVVLEIADKFVERAMVKYAEAGEVTDRLEVCLNRAVAWLERARALSEGTGFDISSDIDKAVRTEVLKEEVFGNRGWLSEGDMPWTGDSIGAYANCTTVDSYLEAIIARINLWLQE